MKHSNRRTTQISFRLSEDLRNDLDKLKKSLHAGDDSEAIRFCMVYTIASMDNLDKDKLSEAFAIALGETLFGGGNKIENTATSEKKGKRGKAARDTGD